MRDKGPRPPQATAPLPDDDPTLEVLRRILFEQDRSRIDQLEAKLDGLDQRVTDRDALIATISPVLGDAIRRQIRDSRQEMIDALYPIVGQLVVRAVSEAMRDLARSVDAQMRRSFNLRALWWRSRAWLGGASREEISLRAALPCEVSQILLVHWQTGLLLWHMASDPATAKDLDLVSSMLTAIRDFTQDAFGRGIEGELDEIEYGNQHILIESVQHAYLAVVMEGVEPPGFRAQMRDCAIAVEHRFSELLSHYEGDPTGLAPVESILRPLLANGRQDAER